jgi:MYXO-CTERM domain-containing protein
VTRALLPGLALGATFAVGLEPVTAHAFCRTSACEDGEGKSCTPAAPDDCGIPIFWPTSCVGFSVQKDASAQIDLEPTEELLARAFGAWANASCEGGRPSIEIENLGSVSCASIGYDPEVKNANLIVFRDEGWPYGPGALALTTVTYVVDTGEIRDADMELNTTDVDFSFSDSTVTIDLESILTHEAGHFLGLAHSPVPEATMIVQYPPESISLRSLDDDDVAGICAVYPSDRVAACEPEPINGLGDTCAEEPGSGCSCRLEDATTPTPVALLGAAFALWIARRRRG